MSKINQLSFKRNFSWNFIGSLVSSASRFFIIMLLAKLGDPVMVGLYSIGMAITSPIISLTNLQLRQIQATDTVDKLYTFKDYFGLRTIMNILMLVLTLSVVLLNNYSIEKSLIVLLIGLERAIDAFRDVFFGHLQQRERMDYIGKSRVIKGISTIVVLGIVLFLTNNLLISLIALNILGLTIFFYYDRKKLQLFLKDIKPSFKYRKLKSLFILALPLGFVLMLNSLNTNLPRIIVEKLLGEAALGYFSSIAYLLVVGNTFVQAVGQAAAPRLAKLYNEKKFTKFKKIVNYLIVMGMSLGFLGLIVSTFLGKFLLTVLYDSTYADYNHILVLIMLAGVFSFTRSFLGYGLTSMRYFKIQPYINCLAVIATVTLSIILVPKYNLTGAAYTLIIASFIQCLLYYLVIKQKLKYSV